MFDGHTVPSSNSENEFQFFPLPGTTTSRLLSFPSTRKTSEFIAPYFRSDIHQDDLQNGLNSVAGGQSRSSEDTLEPPVLDIDSLVNDMRDNLNYASKQNLNNTSILEPTKDLLLNDSLNSNEISTTFYPQTQQQLYRQRYPEIGNLRMLSLSNPSVLFPNLSNEQNQESSVNQLVHSQLHYESNQQNKFDYLQQQQHQSSHLSKNYFGYPNNINLQATQHSVVAPYSNLSNPCSSQTIQQHFQNHCNNNKNDKNNSSNINDLNIGHNINIGQPDTSSLLNFSHLNEVDAIQILAQMGQESQQAMPNKISNNGNNKQQLKKKKYIFNAHTSSSMSSESSSSPLYFQFDDHFKPKTHNTNNNNNNTEKACFNCGTNKTPSWRRCPERRKLLCNACGLYLKIHGMDRPFIVTEEGVIKTQRQTVMKTHTCSNCLTNETPLWRRNPDGNACGLFLKVHKRNRLSSSSLLSSSGKESI